jgi:glutathione S-transferase
MTPLLLKLVFTALPARAPGLLKGLVKGIAGRPRAASSIRSSKTHVDYWEAELAKSAWFAGPDFTAADIMMSFPLEAGRRPGRSRVAPHVKAFLDRIHARPAYQRALERGGPYDYA